MNQQQLDILNCIVCLEFAIGAIECNSCQAIYCQSCKVDIMNVKNQCAQCRQVPMQFKNNLIVRKLLDTIPAQCPLGCDEKLSVGQLKAHQIKCPMKPIKCRFCDSSFQKSQIVQHMNEQHLEQLLQILDPEYQSQKEEDNQEVSVNVIGTQVNQNGHSARLGKYGKYYCGKELNQNCKPNGNWGCCNGYCGTTDGCNCQACMKLDIKARQLGKGYLVNREGRISKFDSIQQRFYCGSKVMDNNSFFNDGYCGPNDGNNCPACMKLDYQHDKRYKDVHS